MHLIDQLPKAQIAGFVNGARFGGFSDRTSPVLTMSTVIKSAVVKEGTKLHIAISQLLRIHFCQSKNGNPGAVDQAHRSLSYDG